jgi:hypothetical protein
VFSKASDQKQRKIAYDIIREQLEMRFLSVNQLPLPEVAAGDADQIIQHLPINRKLLIVDQVVTGKNIMFKLHVSG